MTTVKEELPHEDYHYEITKSGPLRYLKWPNSVENFDDDCNNLENLIKLQTIRINKSIPNQNTSAKYPSSNLNFSCEPDSLIFDTANGSLLDRKQRKTNKFSIERDNFKSGSINVKREITCDQSTQCNMVAKDHSLSGITDELGTLNSLFKMEALRKAKFRAKRLKRHRSSASEEITSNLRVFRATRSSAGTVEIVVGEDESSMFVN